MAIERFTPAERLYHWANAAAVTLLLASGALIWQDLDKWRPNGVNVLEKGHFWLGGGLMVGSLVLFLLLRRRRIPQARERFNPGQRLSLRAFQVLLGWMLASGIVIEFGKAWGMTKPVRGLFKQAHLLSAAAILALVIGHLGMVLLVAKNRGILAAMVKGSVDRDVLARSNPEWLKRVESEA
ncbi:MAG TPA: cytochrome b/b6 domain-containing protein [Pantanalinema sp.]